MNAHNDKNVEKQNKAAALLHSISWYPGHMKKAIDDIALLAKRADAIIEVLDARGIQATKNPELTRLFTGKPTLRIALKADLADLTANQNAEGVLVCTKKQKRMQQTLIAHLDVLMKARRERLQAKGLVAPLFNVAVIGLPNVGKSTLINLLCQKNKMRTENRPGVTRTISAVRINQSFAVLDTPGIMFKKIASFDLGAALTLMGTIRPEAISLDDVLDWGYAYLKQMYPKLLTNFANNTHSYREFLTSAAQKYGYLSTGGECDLARSAKAFMHALSTGQLGRVTYLV